MGTAGSQGRIEGRREVLGGGRDSCGSQSLSVAESQSYSGCQALDRAVGNMNPSHDSPTDGEGEEFHSFLTLPGLSLCLPRQRTKNTGGHLPRTGGLHVTVIGSYNMELSHGHF